MRTPQFVFGCVAIIGGLSLSILSNAGDFAALAACGVGVILIAWGLKRS